MLRIRETPEMHYCIDLDLQREAAKHNKSYDSSYLKGEVFSPLTDFLTHKTVGPNLDERKGEVEASKSNGAFTEVAVVVEDVPIKYGDVVLFDRYISGGASSNNDVWAELKPIPVSQEQKIPSLASQTVEAAPISATMPASTSEPAASPLSLHVQHVEPPNKSEPVPPASAELDFPSKAPTMASVSTDSVQIRKAEAAISEIAEKPADPSPIVSSTQAKVCTVSGVKSGDSLNVRSTPDSGSQVVSELANGEQVRIRGDSVMNGATEWMPISSGSQDGWVVRKYLRDGDSEEAKSQSGDQVKKTLSNFINQAGATITKAVEKSLDLPSATPAPPQDR